MKIIIVGCGITGQSIIGALEKEGHDICCVDTENENLTRVSNKYDVITVLGNGADVEVLKEAGADKADLLIAMTSGDEQNILCALTAKKMGTINTIARIRNPQYESQLEMFKEELGLSLHINPELAFAEEVARILKFPSAFNIETFAKGKVQLIGIKLDQNNKLCNISLMDMSKRNEGVLVCAVKRGEQTIIPRGDFTFKGGDIFYITASTNHAHSFAKKMGLLSQRIKKVMIIGGGIDSYYIARELLDSKMAVKIIEPDYERCQYLLENLNGVSVSMGSLTDTELLIEEGIAEVDAVCCLTGSEDKNTMLSLFASSQNKDAKIIVRYDSNDSKVLMESAGITDTVSPKNVAADIITSYVRAKANVSGGSVKTLYKLLDGTLEAVEFLAEDGSKITGKPLKEMKTKSSTLIGSIVRKDTIIVPRGDTIIQDKDSVIVVTTDSQLESAEDILAD